MCEAAHQEWLSLFTTEMEFLWNTEPAEIRMIVIIYHILQKEFKRIELNIDEKIKNFKHKIKLTSTLDDSCLELSSTETATDSIERSPTLKRYRKINRSKNISSPSLLQKSRDSLDCSSFSLLKPVTEVKADDCAKQSNTPKADVIDCDLYPNEIVDSSILNDSNNGSHFYNKKFKLSKSKTKGLFNKSDKGILTLTQLLDTKEFSRNASKIKKQDIANNKKKSNILNNVPQKSNLFQNYDSLPVKKSNVPEHPHKTEPVRRKADKLKLPGWSCKECQQYYEDFDLNEEELREKMKICSKHRNKFQPLDETPAGFWDVTIFSSQDD